MDTRRSIFGKLLSTSLSLLGIASADVMPKIPENRPCTLAEYRNIKAFLLKNGWSRFVMPGPVADIWFPVYQQDGALSNSVWTRFVNPNQSLSLEVSILEMLGMKAQEMYDL